jgi:hypothetical protein
MPELCRATLRVRINKIINTTNAINGGSVSAGLANRSKYPPVVLFIVESGLYKTDLIIIQPGDKKY